MTHLWSAPTGNGIPTASRLEALHLYGRVNSVTTDGDITKVLRVGTRGCQPVERGVDKAQRMSSYLIGDSNNPGPDRRAGAGPSDLEPATGDVECHAREGIGICRDIG